MLNFSLISLTFLYKLGDLLVRVLLALLLTLIVEHRQGVQERFAV